MLRFLSVLAAAGFLAACDGPAAQPGEVSTPSQSAAGEVDLIGEWVVSRIGDRSLRSRVPLLGTEDTLVWQPACAGFSISYRKAGAGLEFYSVEREGLRTVCLPGHPEDLPRVLSALRGKWSAQARENGDIVLTRSDSKIVLERPREHPQEDLTGEWRVAGIDGREVTGSEGIALSADNWSIWWEPRCAAQWVPYRIVNERFIVPELPPAPPPPPPTPGEAPPPPLPVICTLRPPPGVESVMKALRAADAIKRTSENSVQISGSGSSVTLFSQ